MKYIFVLLVLLIVGSVAAVDLSDACTYKGYVTSVSMWEYNGSYIEVYDDGTLIDVNGTARKMNWTSDKYIDAVVYKSGSRIYTTDGGFNGTVPKTTLSNDIVFVAFCTNTGEVPEFGLLAGCVALVGALGVYVIRRN